MKQANWNNFGESTLQLLAKDQADALFDVYAMRCALRLATRGAVEAGSPRVGCLVVCENGDVVGEGFYVEKEVKHAEVVALEQAGERARRSTVYVTLEPHAHFSRTAPCTDAIIAAGVRRVVAAMIDPNPLVAGKGIERLRAAGIETEVGLLEREASIINREYVRLMNEKREASNQVAATAGI